MGLEECSRYPPCCCVREIKGLQRRNAVYPYSKPRRRMTIGRRLAEATADAESCYALFVIPLAVVILVIAGYLFASNGWWVVAAICWGCAIPLAEKSRGVDAVMAFGALCGILSAIGAALGL